MPTRLTESSRRVLRTKPRWITGGPSVPGKPCKFCKSWQSSPENPLVSQSRIVKTARVVKGGRGEGRWKLVTDADGTVMTRDSITAQNYHRACWNEYERNRSKKLRTEKAEARRQARVIAKTKAELSQIERDEMEFRDFQLVSKIEKVLKRMLSQGQGQGQGQGHPPSQPATPLAKPRYETIYDESRRRGGVISVADLYVKPELASVEERHAKERKFLDNFPELTENDKDNIVKGLV